MAKLKATSNVVFVIDGEEIQFDENKKYEIEEQKAAELNAKGLLAHPELSPFFVPIDETDEAEE